VVAPRFVLRSGKFNEQEGGGLEGVASEAELGERIDHIAPRTLFDFSDLILTAATEKRFQQRNCRLRRYLGERRDGLGVLGPCERVAHVERSVDVEDASR